MIQSLRGLLTSYSNHHRLLTYYSWRGGGVR